MAASQTTSSFVGAGSNPRANQAVLRLLRQITLLLLVAGCALFLKFGMVLPPGTVSQGVSPILLRYRVIGSPGYSATDLKTLQTWVLQRHFRAVPGVIEATGDAGEDGIVEGSVLVTGADRRAAEDDLDSINRSGILPPGIRLEKIPTPSVKRDIRRGRQAG
jgi:hypothetical protein